jgi:hypothetical protein
MEEIRKIASDLGNRIKGTYGATFILVWSVFNWRLIYIILNFDKTYTLKHKINVLNCYLAHDKGHHNTFWYPLVMSILSIIGYYLMNYLTFAISGIFNLRLKPWIQDRIDKIKSTIVSKELYDTLNAQHKELQDKYKVENENYVRNSEELKKVKEDFERIDADNNTLRLIKENSEKNYSFNQVSPSQMLSGFWKKTKRNRHSNNVEIEEFNTQNNTSYINKKPFLSYSNFKINKERFLIIESEVIDTKVQLKTRLVIVSDNLYLGYETDSINIYDVEYVRI